MASRSLSPSGRTIGKEVRRLSGIEAYSTEGTVVQRHTTTFGSPQPEALGETISQLHATQKLTEGILGSAPDTAAGDWAASEELTSRQEQLY